MFVYGRRMKTTSQRAVLEALLAAHPRLLHRDELEAQLGETETALRVLIDDGLARRVGDLVGVSRAAVRFENLRA